MYQTSHALVCTRQTLGGQEQVEELGKQMLGAAQNEAPAAAAMQAKLAASAIPDLSALGIDAQKLAARANKKRKASERAG